MLLHNDTVLVDVSQLKKATGILRAFRNKRRQTLLSILDEHKRMTVTEIYTKLKLEQSVACQQLAILLKAGIIIKEKQFKYAFYSNI
jgi:DNA-binding transcriptional ArsR family regulator